MTAQMVVISKYANQIGRAQSALNRLAQYLDDHGEVGPDDVTYAHVGSMEHLANQLSELQDMIDGTGEFAS